MIGGTAVATGLAVIYISAAALECNAWNIDTAIYTGLAAGAVSCVGTALLKVGRYA